MGWLETYRLGLRVCSRLWQIPVHTHALVSVSVALRESQIKVPSKHRGRLAKCGVPQCWVLHAIRARTPSAGCRTSTRGHPLQVARVNLTGVAHKVLVCHHAIQHVRHRLKPPVRMIGEPCWQRNVELVQLNEAHAQQDTRSSTYGPIRRGGRNPGEPQTLTHALVSESERGVTESYAMSPSPKYMSAQARVCQH
jgi:hypothetical protein